VQIFFKCWYLKGILFRLKYCKWIARSERFILICLETISYMTLPIMTVEVSAINHPGFRTFAVCRSERASERSASHFPIWLTGDGCVYCARSRAVDKRRFKKGKSIEKRCAFSSPSGVYTGTKAAYNRVCKALITTTLKARPGYFRFDRATRPTNVNLHIWCV